MRTLKVYVGPCSVKEISRAIAATGIVVTCEGTEHIYIELHENADRSYLETLHKALIAKHGKTFGITHRDLQPL